MINYPFGLDGISIDRLNQFSGNPSNDGMRRYIFGDNRSRRDDRAFPHSHTISDDRARSKPDVIFDDNSFRSDPLLHKRSIRVVKNMIDRDDLRERRGIHAVSDLHASLAANNGIFPDQTIASDLDAGLWHVSKIIDVQDCSMHDDSPRSDLDSPRARMQINTFIQVHTVTQLDMIRKP